METSMKMPFTGTFRINIKKNYDCHYRAKFCQYNFPSIGNIPEMPTAAHSEKIIVPTEINYETSMTLPKESRKKSQPKKFTLAVKNVPIPSKREMVDKDDSHSRGKVYIASMEVRGKWAQRPNNVTIINVTSGQSRNSRNRRDFSPMTPIENGYKGFWNFESYWQSGKVFDGIPREKTLTFWKNKKEPARKYPGAKNARVIYSVWDHITQPLGYIDSRKKVYIPEYFELIKNTGLIVLMSF